MNNIEFQKYYISLYLDSVFFCDDSIARIKDNIDSITSSEALEVFYDTLVEIESTLCYPKEVVNSIGEIIDYIETHIKEENIELFNKIKNKYFEIKDLEFNDGKYLYEAILKCLDVDNVYNQNFNVEVIRNSIIFDYYAFTSFLSDDIEIDKNYYYIMALKKLMIVYPEIFLDKEINKRALDILEKNKEYDEAERLTYKMEHIDLFLDVHFNFSEFTSVIDYTVVEAMLLKRQNIQKYKPLLTSGSIHTVFEIIDKNCLDNEVMKKNLYDIMSTYKEMYFEDPSIPKDIKKRFMLKYNEYIGKLNQINNYDQDTVMGEFKLRTDIIDKIKTMFKPFKLDGLFDQDIEYLKHIIYSSEIDNKDTLYLTLNKCLRLIPSMFDNKKIYDKTMSLLDENNIHNKLVKKKINKIYRG